MFRQLIGPSLLTAAALLGTSPALAQSAATSEALSAVLACADVDREILRLECYDEAVAAIRSQSESTRGEASTDRAAAAPAALPAEDSGRRAGVVDRTVAGEDTPAAASTGRDSGSRAAPPAAATIDIEGGARSPAAAATRDDRDAAEGDDRDRQVTIVDVRTSIPGRAVFVTSDGEEFVQTSGRLRLYLPEVPFVANLRSGAVGGRFLTPEGTRRSIRISERN